MQTRPPSDSITEAAYRRLRSDLLSCRLRPGDKLRITQLQEELGSSLCAVREALARLSSEGFVTSVPQRGFRAAPISVADLLDLTHARVEVETLCLRSAISMGGLEWETRLVGANHRLQRIAMRASEDSRQYNLEWNLAHDEFHMSLVAACGNLTLLRVREQLYDKSARYRWLSVSMSTIHRNVTGEHDAIVAACLERDAESACALLTMHVKETSRILAKAMNSGAAEAAIAKLPARATKARRA